MRRFFTHASLALLLLVAAFVLYFGLLRTEEPRNESYEWVVFAEGFTRPLYVTHAGDERLFVVEQRGLVHILDAKGERLPTPFLDLQEVVRDTDNEQGLLSLAFDPADPSVFYVNFTGEPLGHTFIWRGRVSADEPNQADPEAYEEILRIEQPFGNHNGGLLKFGPDGYLYIGMGDGGAANDPYGHGQNPFSLLGKMLRIDVRAEPAEGLAYAIPSDNPFADGKNGAPEVWALGLRNPWRFSFDRATGDLFIGDVGQNKVEEISYLSADFGAGANFGWRLFEGLSKFEAGARITDVENYVPPIFDYSHNATVAFIEQDVTRTAHCSVTGGYVYRGKALPALVGQYLFGDYCSGSLWALAKVGEVWQGRPFMATAFTVSSFGEDVAGELYITSFSGEVWKLVARGEG